MAWYRQATSHYLSQYWPRFMSSYGVTRPQWVRLKSQEILLDYNVFIVAQSFCFRWVSEKYHICNSHQFCVVPWNVWWSSSNCLRFQNRSCYLEENDFCCTHKWKRTGFIAPCIYKIYTNSVPSPPYNTPQWLLHILIFVYCGLGLAIFTIISLVEALLVIITLHQCQWYNLEDLGNGSTRVH